MKEPRVIKTRPVTTLERERHGAQWRNTEKLRMKSRSLILRDVPNQGRPITINMIAGALDRRAAAGSVFEPFPIHCPDQRQQPLERIAAHPVPHRIGADCGPRDGPCGAKSERSVRAQLRKRAPGELQVVRQLGPPQEGLGRLALLGQALQELDLVAPLEMPAERFRYFPTASFSSAALSSATMLAAQITAPRNGA